MSEYPCMCTWEANKNESIKTWLTCPDHVVAGKRYIAENEWENFDFPVNRHVAAEIEISGCTAEEYMAGTALI